MILLGTATAVPVLLMLNMLVSVAAVERDLWRREAALIGRAIVGCLVGIGLGLLVYPLLSESMVLALTGVLLLIGLVVSCYPACLDFGHRGEKAVSVLSGLATIWAATPGPLMVLGFLAMGRSPSEVRRLVQPVALIAYGTAFTLHLVADWHILAQASGLAVFSLAAIVGALLGRILGPLLPIPLISGAVRIFSAAACVALFRRAYLGV